MWDFVFFSLYKLLYVLDLCSKAENYKQNHALNICLLLIGQMFEYFEYLVL